MSSLKSAHFAMIHYQTWPPQAMLVSDWPIFTNFGRFLAHLAMAMFVNGSGRNEQTL
jgi:hypothetical protein